jgi:hypothetical protein
LVEGSMSNRDLGIAAVAVVVLLGMLMAGGWYYRDQKYEPLERIESTNMVAGALRQRSGPARLSVPQPWRSGDAKNDAVLGELARMLRDAELLSVSAYVESTAFQPDILLIWFEGGTQMTVTPALECVYTVGSETCSFVENEIIVSSLSSAVQIRMESGEMHDWLMEGWQEDARMGSPQEADEVLTQLGY